MGGDLKVEVEVARGEEDGLLRDWEKAWGRGAPGFDLASRVRRKVFFCVGWDGSVRSGLTGLRYLKPKLNQIKYFLNSLID
jgi:hypothetical protein